VQLAQAVLEHLAETNQNGRIDAAQDERIDQFLEIDPALRVLVGMYPNVAIRPMEKIAFAPAIDIVSILGIIDRPALAGFEQNGFSRALCCQNSSVLRNAVTGQVEFD
jgi:hypothetical protein